MECLCAGQAAEMQESKLNENVEAEVDLTLWMSQKRVFPPRVFPYIQQQHLQCYLNFPHSFNLTSPIMGI